MKYNVREKLLVSRVLTVAAGVALLGVSDAAAARDLKVGDKMPAFTLTDIKGKTVRLASFKNRPVWLTFFGST